MTSATEKSYVDPTLINPRAVRLIEAFKEALIRMRHEHGLTFEDLKATTDLLDKMHAATGLPLSALSMPMWSELFQGGQDGYTPSEGLSGPSYVPGAPAISNPGSLPMRPDEPGVPLIAFGRVLDGNGRPLAGAELDIYHAANDGNYAGIYDDGRPKYNLRGRQVTDADGRYEFTTITPAAYTDTNIAVIDEVKEAAAAVGRSLYRPAHIHYEIHHPDLPTPWRGEVYFSGDPVIPVDLVGPKLAHPSLQATAVLHDDPEEMTERGLQVPFNTAEFDFVLKTRTSPDSAVPKETAA
ncbi:hypothetical protein [Streptomyces acidicola]|uniref:dioxygenase family protein n=1 Tax=Streptomyces acidicola TaxID=2596892 RepID=UPI00343BC153